MSDDILIARSLVKQFHERKAVDGLTFTVKRGEIFALLGPNGAGKTTAIRMLLGIIKPDSGSIKFNLGRSCEGSQAGAQLGYLPEDRGLYRDIPITKTLIYIGALRGLSRKEAASRAHSWLERVGLGDRSNDKLEALSKGNQQKVQFVSAILHQPEFAVLDEPFTGLDPINQESFLTMIGELRKEGMTVLLSTHQMGLVERIADKVLLMNCGQQLLFGTLAQIRESSSTSSKIVVSVAADTDITELRDSPLVQKVEQKGKREYVFYIKRGSSPQQFLIKAASTVELIDIYTEKTSLHDIFIEVVRRSKKEIPGGCSQ